MKKFIALSLAAIMVVSVCACGSEKTKSAGKEIFSCYDLEVQNFVESFDASEIVTMIYQKNHDVSEKFILEDKKQINKLFQALCKVEVLEKTEERASDYDDIFIFTLRTAQAFTFSFNKHHLVIGNDAYYVQGDEELWKIAKEISSSENAQGEVKGQMEDYQKKEESQQEKIKVIPTAAEQVVLEDYQTSEFSMKLPTGWVVNSGGDGMAFSLCAYDPQNPVNQVFVLLKAMPLMHDPNSRSYYEQSQQMYGGNYYIMADAPALENPSTENFYQIFSSYASFAEKDEPSYYGYTFPRFHDFTVMEAFESNSNMKSIAINPALLRASFTDESGRRGEGMFTADVVDFSGNLQDASWMFGFDTGYYMAYNIMAVTAEENSFIDWESILCQCLASIDFTDAFVSNAIAQSNETVANSRQLSQTLSDTSDMIMSSWETRNTSDDIIRQKQSDATLGFERIYDTEKDKIYKATNGWSDKYADDRFKLVTDDSMYTRPIDGYIDY